MEALLNQLGLDNTFFVELAIIAVLFFALSHFYFRPFLKLFEARLKKTVEDREAGAKRRRAKPKFCSKQEMKQKRLPKKRQILLINNEKILKSSFNPTWMT